MMRFVNSWNTDWSDVSCVINHKFNDLVITQQRLGGFRCGL